MTESNYDLITVGSGHNGMIAAAYLAKAGLKVLVVERRPIVGGAVCTQDDLIPGYKIDVGSSAHVMIHQTPVLQDLELERFGLEYIEMDPWAWYPSVNGQPAIHFYRDLAKTCESIALTSRDDARRYRNFVEAWQDLNQGVFQAFLRPPTPWNLVRSMFGRSLGGSNRLEMIRKLMGPYGQLIQESFASENLRTAITWLAAQSGPPPGEAATGDFAGWHAMYHLSGMKRAKGGSGALTQALQRRIEEDGGTVLVSAPVNRIQVQNGRVTGVRLEDGRTFESKAVIAACHIKTTVEQLLEPDDLPAPLREKVGHLRIGNGFGMIVRCAMDGLPPYPGEPTDAHGVAEAHRGLQLLCPSRAALQRAYADYLRGRPPEEPIPLGMSFSAIDPTLAPPGKHTLFIWGQYHPYEMEAGRSWADIEEREADKLIAAVDRFAPGTRDLVIDRYIQTPAKIEALHGMHRANVMHLEMSFDQMFLFRPTTELSDYTTPIRGLYLTGASTHPGGGVWGASGHNTAKVVLRQRRRWK